MSVFLKIKAKHLATEPAIIKHELKKVSGNSTLFYQLYTHKQTVLKPEARATELARAFLAGKPYEVVEAGKRKPEKEYDFQRRVLPRTLKLVQKYGNKSITLDDLKDWAACKS